MTMRHFLLATAATMALAGCQLWGTKPVAEAPPQHHADIAEAIQFLAENLSKQIQGKDIGGGKTIPVDLFFNEHSAEEAATAKALQRNLVAALSAATPGVTFAPLTTRNIQNAPWVVLASYANIKSEEAGKAGKWIRLKVAMEEVKTGTSVARATTHVEAGQFNQAPAPFYREAPMYLTDAAHADRKAVLGGGKRSMAGGIALRAAQTEAVEAYEAGRYAEAEDGFRKLLETAPDNTLALSGLYQSLWRQGRKAEAEEAFGKLANAGFDAGRISVKLLFRLNQTEFIDDADLSQQYQVWLKSLASQLVNRKECLDVVGHASASGTTEYNTRLSLSRASRIVARMAQTNAGAGKRLKATGKGASETIVGTGANDASDAIDRRVEFLIDSCER
jgi:outer membrane protein OmpA-like peptidoglycan-associated protein